MTTERITIEQLAAYLPWSINCYSTELRDESDSPIKAELVGLNDKYVELHEIGRTITEQYPYFKVKPILRPLSSLTKEITHNGETFVPIEWFEIGDDNNESLEYDNGNIKLVKQLESITKHGIVNDIQYLPYAVVQKLLEWKFDTWGLINKNLAVEYEH